MQYISHTLDFKIEEPTVLTLGKFDGLHRGHSTLMETMKQESSRHGLKTVVFTFDMPPKNRVDHSLGAVLTTNEEKHLIFEQAGADYLVECPFTPEIMKMEPKEFIRWIVSSLNVKVIVAGTDCGFGYKRAGNYESLLEWQEELGYHAIIIEKLQEDGKDISSTFVREEISKGNIEKANHLLGYDYFVMSRIVHGRKLGRTIGIPTINMILPDNKLLPPYGVYVTRVKVGEKSYMGVSNVGCKPTISGDNPVGVETFIIDFSQDLYDKVVTVEFLTFVRPEMKFPSIDALKEQMSKDIETAKLYYQTHGE